MMIEDPLPSYRFIVTLDPADAHLPPAQAALLPLVRNIIGAICDESPNTPPLGSITAMS